MSVLDKFLSVMKLNEDDEDDDYDYEENGFDDDYENEPVVRNTKKKAKQKEDVYDVEERFSKEKTTKSSGKVTPMRPATKKTATSGMEVCVVKPISVEDAREITETLLTNRTVVLNLEGLDIDIAQRIIDFTSGSCFAMNGNLRKISNYIFIITPPSVDISGDFQDVLDAFEVPGIQTDF